MAIVDFNKKLFEKDIGKLDEKMQEKVALFGTPIENITENKLQLEIFPNRPDLLSYQGFLRAFKVYLGKEKELKKYKIEKPKKEYYVIIDKSVEKVRPFTACAIINNIKFDDDRIKEIIDLQEKLHNTIGRKRKKIAIGIYPLNKIKFPITYKALEPDKIKFIPLGTKEEMSGFQILQRIPAGREYSHLLAQKEKFPIFVDSNNNVLSMPPIINSELTGKIDLSTKDIFIECSGFDFNSLKKCLNIIVTSLAEMNGTIQAVELKYSKKEITPNLNPETMKIDIKNANKILGLNLNEKQIKELLEKMGYESNRNNVIIPAWRIDILHEVDLIEDIAIAYGYQNFLPRIPEIASIGKEDKIETIKKKISEILIGKEFLELSNYHLTTKDDQLIRMAIKPKNFIEIEDVKTNFSILRQDLSHYILKILSENVDAEYPQRLFEIGTIFEQTDKKIIEKQNLCIAISPGNFTDLKQILEYISLMLDINIKIMETDETPDHFIEGRVGKIIINDVTSGYIGEVHPKILKNWKIKMPVSLLEINLEEIFNKFIKNYQTKGSL